MAMNANTLASEIKSKVDALSEKEKQTDIKVWTAVAEAVVDHIKNNAEIAPLTISGISVSPPSAVITQGATLQGTNKIS